MTENTTNSEKQAEYLAQKKKIKNIPTIKKVILLCKKMLIPTKPSPASNTSQKTQ